MARRLILLVLAIPVLAADPPAADKVLKLVRLSVDAQASIFVAEGEARSLPEGTVLAGQLFLGPAGGPWARGEVRLSKFRMEFSTEGREVLDGTYRVVVALRPEDQDPAAKMPAGRIGPVGLLTTVGDKKSAIERERLARKEYLDAVEELRSIAEEMARRSSAARPEAPRPSKSARAVVPAKDRKHPEVLGAVALETSPLEEWSSHAGAEGPAWTRFNALRREVQDREGTWFISPVPHIEGPMAMVFGTWEKWFFSVWKDTCDGAHQPLPEPIYLLGGEPMPRLPVEESLRQATDAAYKAIGAKAVSWRVQPDAPGKSKAKR